jgi:hypothetical protein
MKAPRPSAMRIVTRTRAAKLPKPPLGLRSWSGEGEAIAVLLDAGTGDPRSLDEVVAQVPHASTLAPGTVVVVLGTAVSERPFWQVFARGVDVPRAVRCSALVARGYIEVGAARDDGTGADIAWGKS